MINWEIELDFSSSKECTIISEISITHAEAENSNVNPPVQTREAIQTTGATFKTNNAKLYVPVLILSINNNIKFLENIKQDFKRTISWNKCRFEITTQRKKNNLDYLIDLIFRNVNRLLVFSFKNGNNDPTKHCFHEY